MTLNELKLIRLSSMIHEWEMQLRAKVKYGDTQGTTWDDVREMYYSIREEFLHIDLMNEELDAD